MKLARLAVALAAVTALTACSDDPEPNFEPSESPTSEPTASTSEPSRSARPRGDSDRAWVQDESATLFRVETLRILEPLRDPA